MSQIKLLKNVIDDIKSLSESLEELYYSMCKEDESNYEETENKEKNNVSLEEIRTILAVKAQEGKQEEIKELIKSYGANKLSEVDSKYYKDLLEKSGGL